MPDLRFQDIRDERGFVAIPPCADPRFDHRTCDYWEDAAQGRNLARPGWLHASAPSSSLRPSPGPSDNPFARAADAPSDEAAELAALLRSSDPSTQGMMASAADVLAGDDLFATPSWNPFAPGSGERPRTEGVPRKLGLLDRGRGIFGSYARVAVLGESPVAYAQFGPLSAYPRARNIRELYPQLPSAPPPGVITCIATVGEARGMGFARALIGNVCAELAHRGFAAVETYPDLTRPIDETSAADPRFWLGCGFRVAVDDARYPVMRRELE